MSTHIWENYRETYPTRYLAEGEFDKELAEHIRTTAPKTAVDIGGGTGTEALKAVPSTWLLDPYQSRLPEWMAGRVLWGNPLVFDLVVLRGSINYLTSKQLLRAAKMVGTNGTLLANTFLNEPAPGIKNRPYVTLAGEEGIEQTNYDPKRKIILHALIPFHGQPIVHEIPYRNEAWFKTHFPGVAIIPRGTNSATIRWHQTPNPNNP